MSKTARYVLAILCTSALPLYAQYTQTTGTTSTEKTTKRPVAKKPEAAAQTSTAGTTEKAAATTEKAATTTTETKKTTHKAKPARAVRAGGGGVRNDVNRLAAVLIDTQNQKSTIPDQAWRVTANEANALANHIYSGTGGTKAARELRTHIREMQSAAMKGDASGARSHASMALPYVYQLIDSTAPAM